MVGSFLNVLIARLPYEKSILWPSSRCFACYQPIRLTDNIPIIGYLRLRGKCRKCGVGYSSRYLWVEIATGLMFLVLFVIDVVSHTTGGPGFIRPIHPVEGLEFSYLNESAILPPLKCWAYFVYHAVLFSLLLAAAVIDAEHRIIPPLITYSGVTIGVIAGALLPWPWPNPVSTATALPTDSSWIFPELWGRIPIGAQPWPFWGPTFAFAPPGSIQLGLLNGILGALAGSLVVRLIKWLFETGFGREALGLGDADLLMMAGAFLGWQIAVLSLFVGAVMALVLKLLGAILMGRKTELADDTRELPFGPGLALGVAVIWLVWPWLGPQVQFVFFDRITLGLTVSVLCVGMLAAGLLLRRPLDEAPPGAKA